jgi:carbamoylphosphate synthase large subunit
MSRSSNGTLAGVIVQFGGQTPLKLAQRWKRPASRSWAPAPDAIDLAEDRERFQQLLTSWTSPSRRTASPAFLGRGPRSPANSASRS